MRIPTAPLAAALLLICTSSPPLVIAAGFSLEDTSTSISFSTRSGSSSSGSDGYFDGEIPTPLSISDDSPIHTNIYGKPPTSLFTNHNSPIHTSPIHTNIDGEIPTPPFTSNDSPTHSTTTPKALPKPTFGNKQNAKEPGRMFRTIDAVCRPRNVKGTVTVINDLDAAMQTYHEQSYIADQCFHGHLVDINAQTPPVDGVTLASYASVDRALNKLLFDIHVIRANVRKEPPANRRYVTLRSAWLGFIARRLLSRVRTASGYDAEKDRVAAKNSVTGKDKDPLFRRIIKRVMRPFKRYPMHYGKEC